MKKTLLLIILFLTSGFLFCNGQTTKAWSVQPYDLRVFIQNAGQFDQEVNEKAVVLYSAKLADYLHVYFTTNGIVYRLIDYPNVNKKTGDLGDPDKDAKPAVMHYLSCHWEGSNPNVTIEGQQEQSDYYTYPTGKSTSVQVNAFKKIIYHNLYPGIDAEFTFPKDTTGFEYALIVHPGADLSQVKLKYKGAKNMSVDPKGNIVIESPVDQIIDHAPLSSYQEGGSVSSNYILKGTEESFSANYDRTKTLVIDPWTWTSSPVIVANRAYDLDYDHQGNVYVYGGTSPYQLVKFNSVGVKLWTFTASSLTAYSYYGDVACDEFSGKCFLVEGLNLSGIHVAQISTAGAQTNITQTQPQLMEGWRILWNPCNPNEMIISGGSWQTPCDAGGAVDTNDNITRINVLNQTPTQTGHDIAIACYDPTGNWGYMATTTSAGDPGNYPNVVIQLPTPALTPPTYYASDGFAFAEANVAQYVGYSTNGMNGMAASTKWLYLYNGANLERLVKNTGVINSTVVVTATIGAWGGLDVDYCDNVYVGENSSVQVYNSALALSNTYACSSTVYDVVLGNNAAGLYACGNGFVSYMPLTPPVCVHAALCNVVLPINLLDFSCQPKAGGITLNWSTASETNNKIFTIERSADGDNFEPIATIPGAGNSSSTRNYSYTDESPLNGINYYRLEQTDFDGASISYNVTSCSISTESVGNVYPNPSTGTFSVVVDNTVSEIQIYNAIGQKIYDKSLLQNSGNTVDVDLSSQASGVYTLYVVQPNQSNRIVKKIVVYPK